MGTKICTKYNWFRLTSSPSPVRNFIWCLLTCQVALVFNDNRCVKTFKSHIGVIDGIYRTHLNVIKSHGVQLDRSLLDSYGPNLNYNIQIKSKNNNKDNDFQNANSVPNNNSNSEGF